MWYVSDKSFLECFRINECVHFAGFNYGRGTYHPYESFVARLHKGDALTDIRAQFETFLCRYRPRHFGEALGITLGRKYPLWLFPWSRFWRYWRIDTNAAWFTDPCDIPDIITHFSSRGIPREMVDKEQNWLFRAYESISKIGYCPESFGYPSGRVLLAADGARACIILDGNHRVSTLSALGYSTVDIRCWPWNIVRQDALDDWPGVRNGYFARQDAEKIFLAYFQDRQSYACGDHLGSIVG